MKNFDELQNLWQQQTPVAGLSHEPAHAMKSAAGIKRKLLREQAIGVTVLAAIVLLIVAVGLFTQFFKRPVTYVGLAMALLVILFQLIVMLSTYFKIKKIDDTLIPSSHLQQWESYYQFRKRQARWNMPLYFITLNIAMCLYLTETIIDHFSVAVVVLLLCYIAFMLFTYFVLEKMSMAREEKRIQQIIAYLRDVLQQLREE